MKKKKKRNRIYRKAALAAGLFIFLSIEAPVLSLQSYGEEIYRAADGNQIEADRLNDKTIEYEELGSLIHYFNTDVQNSMKNVETRKAEYTEAKEYLQFEKSDAHYKKARAKEDKNMEDYGEYAGWEAVYKGAIDGYDDMLKSLDRYASNKGWKLMEKQLTYGAQKMMISYHSVVSRKSYAAKLEEVSREQYENTCLQYQTGMATAQEADEAYNRWKAAEVSLESASGNEETIYKNLCLLLGVESDGSMTVAPIPSVSLSEADEMDLEKDTESAVNNNQDIISIRTGAAAGTAAIRQKENKESTLKEKIRVKMKEMYEEVQQARIAYEAASRGYASAEITWNNAQSKKSMGMLSTKEYLQAEAEYLGKKSSFEAADLGLLQALEDYQWAVKGIITVE